MQLVIQPKLPIDRVLFLLGYARKLPRFVDRADLTTEPEIVEAFVVAFLNSLRATLRRGLILGYRRIEEAIPLVRGRIRFADQARRRFGLPLPVEVVYDEYTPDIEENRLLKAALRRCSQLRVRAPVRWRVAEALAAFEAVGDFRYDKRRVPKFTYTRLTERYREPVELARLILSETSPELEPGDAPVTGMFFDMNRVFEDFVFAAIDEHLRPRLATTETWRQGRSVQLDDGGFLRPLPDLSLWRSRRCVFVGDAKYKTTEKGEAGDLYQLLAYCSATALPEGTLIYAEHTGEALSHQIVHGGPRLRVETVDITAPVDRLLARCAELGELVLRTSARKAAA